MALQLSDNFSYLGKKPLDARLVFNTIQEMENFPINQLYEGCVSYNKETDSLYLFNGAIWDNFSANAMPIAPLEVAFTITSPGTGYQVNDIVSTDKTNLFAKVKQINYLGEITEVVATQETIANTSGTGAYIKAERTLYAGSGNTWEQLLVDDEAIATIPEYNQGITYTKDSLIRFGNIVGIVITDFTSDTTKDSVLDSWNYDISLNKIDLIKGETQNVPECLGETENEGTLQTEIIPISKGNWVLIKDCNITAPGQAGIGLYNGTDWDILPIPKGEFEFPEPTADGKQYLRSRDTGSDNGSWQLLSEVAGNDTTIKIRTTNNLEIIPAVGEPVWFESTNMESGAKEYALFIGDGTSKIANLQTFYGDKYTTAEILAMIGYTPEDADKKGAANGYAPLDENCVVPNAYLPDNLTNTYSKTEVDNINQTTNDSLTLLINQEVSRATTAETANTTKIDEHIANSSVHVTQDEKDAWNAKVDETDLEDFTNHISDSAIHVTQNDKDKWNGMQQAYFVTSFDALPTENNSIGNIGYVRISEDGVTPIVCEEYLWTGTTWQQLDTEGVSIKFNWNNIEDRPAATPLTIDNVVTIAHKHNNKNVLDKIGQTSTGNFTFDGIEIGIKVIFVEVETLLPSVGAEDTLYVVYKDSRTRNYPSISVYKDNAYQILGKGAQENAPVVGDMQILQAEFYNAVANSTQIITYSTPNQFFCFLPVEILVEIAGLTNQSRDILNITSTTQDLAYDENLLEINDSGCSINIAPLEMTLDTVSNNYFSHVDIDTSNYRNVQGIS